MWEQWDMYYVTYVAAWGAKNLWLSSGDIEINTQDVG